VNLLLDTHVILWAAYQPERLSDNTRNMLLDVENTLWFSVASLWEVTIKRALDRADFQVDASVLRAGLLLHRDPFDRMLVAQAASDGFMLVTADQQVAAYEGPIRLVTN